MCVCRYIYIIFLHLGCVYLQSFKWFNLRPLNTHHSTFENSWQQCSGVHITAWVFSWTIRWAQCAHQDLWGRHKWALLKNVYKKTKVFIPAEKFCILNLKNMLCSPTFSFCLKHIIELYWSKSMLQFSNILHYDGIDSFMNLPPFFCIFFCFFRIFCPKRYF